MLGGFSQHPQDLVEDVIEDEFRAVEILPSPQDALLFMVEERTDVVREELDTVLVEFLRLALAVKGRDAGVGGRDKIGLVHRVPKTVHGR